MPRLELSPQFKSEGVADEQISKVSGKVAAKNGDSSYFEIASPTRLFCPSQFRQFFQERVNVV
jgi:hypothetical protein